MPQTTFDNITKALTAIAPYVTIVALYWFTWRKSTAQNLAEGNTQTKPSSPIGERGTRRKRIFLRLLSLAIAIGFGISTILQSLSDEPVSRWFVFVIASNVGVVLLSIGIFTFSLWSQLTLGDETDFVKAFEDGLL